MVHARSEDVGTGHSLAGQVKKNGYEFSSVVENGREEGSEPDRH